MEILIQENLDNHIFEEVAFYDGMLGEFSYDPRQFCITFADIDDRHTDVLRYIGTEDTIHIPEGVMAIPYLLKDGYHAHENITVVNHSRQLIDLDYMFYNTKIKSVSFEGFKGTVFIQTAESMFEKSSLEQIDVTQMNLSKCKNMKRMFAGTKLQKLDLEQIYLSVDTNMDYMCENCVDLEVVKLCNNSSEKKLELSMVEPFLNCNHLKDLQTYDSDEFTVVSFDGDIRKVLPEDSPLFYNVNNFVNGFVPEFDEELGVQLNEFFDIKFINEYSMLIRKSTAKEMLNNIAFIYKMCEELKMDVCGEGNQVSTIHFVKSIEAEIAKRASENSSFKEALLVQPRMSNEEDIVVYVIYHDKQISGYRIKHNNKYYDVTTAEYAQLGLNSILPSKKLKMTNENNRLVVRQRYGETITIYGFKELAEALGVELE